jgi:hypothetical protein
MMSETLQMIFSNADGRNTTISIADPEVDLTALEVESVMDSVITRNIFQTTGGNIISKVRAQIVARTVDILSEY